MSAVARIGTEPTGAEPLAAVPTNDELIERWDSLIRWSEIQRVRVERRTSSAYHRWKVPVRCGCCNQWRTILVWDTKPPGGVLNADCLRDPHYSYDKFGGFTGLCSACLMRLSRPNVKYFDGTELLHAERTKDGLPVVCDACKKRGFLKCALSETLHDKHWACPSCGEVLGKWLHKESGATVYWLRRKEGQRNYVAFDCAGCGGQFYCKDELPPRPAWLGMCPGCRQDKHPLAIKKVRLASVDKEVGYAERFGEGKPKRGRKRGRWGLKVRLPCPLPGCGKMNEFHFDTTRKPGFLALCKPGKGGHTRDEIASFYMRREQNGNESVNGRTETRRRQTRAKPAQRTANVLGKTIADLSDSILKLFASLKVNTLVTLAKTAEHCGLGRVGYGDEGGQNIRRLLERNGVKDSFPVYRDRLIAARGASNSDAEATRSTLQFYGVT